MDREAILEEIAQIIDENDWSDEQWEQILLYGKSVEWALTQGIDKAYREYAAFGEYLRSEVRVRRN